MFKCQHLKTISVLLEVITREGVKKFALKKFETYRNDGRNVSQLVTLCFHCRSCFNIPYLLLGYAFAPELSDRMQKVL
jgi:hypothetical protein